MEDQGTKDDQQGRKEDQGRRIQKGTLGTDDDANDVLLWLLMSFWNIKIALLNEHRF